MKEKLRIGEFAKLHNVTTETLRHYDRIGLLSPIEIDNTSGYRYYSLLQDEKLTIILELRKLGMSLDAIIKFFENKNVNQSLNLLKEEYEKLKNRIEDLQRLEKTIKKKIENIEEMFTEKEVGKIFFREIKDRYIIKIDKYIDSDEDFKYGLVKLDGMLMETAPYLANNRLGTIVDKDDIDSIDGKKRLFKLFMFIDGDNVSYKEYREVIEGGLYACMYTPGPSNDIGRAMRYLKQSITKEGYDVVGDCLEFNRIDSSLTDNYREELYEVQIPVKKHLTLV